MAVFRAALLLVTGILAGVLIARYLPHGTPASKSPQQQSAASAMTIKDSVLAPATVTLRGSNNDKLQSTTLATAINDNIVVAMIADFVGARRLVVETAHGQIVPVSAVLSADERYGIALLATERPLENVEILQPEPGAGSLHLGRPLTLLTQNDRYGAEVDSAGYRDELGAYRYAIKVPAGRPGDAAAIIDPRSGSLLGLIAGKHSASQAIAVDNEPINRLVDRLGSERRRTLDEFSHYYFNETASGRLALLDQFVASGQFDTAIQIGRNMLNLDSYTQKYGAELLHRAYAGAVRQAMDNGQWRMALRLLDEADQAVGLNDKLRLMRAESRQSVGELEGALDDLLTLGDTNTHQARMLVIENALAAGHTDGESSLSLLQRALAADPDYAPYHRLLGETLARRGDMTGALAALERAIALDPGIATEVAPLLSRLRARRNTPPLTEVPIQRRRSTLYVDASINGSTETFRFLLDTGASYTAITTETALRLGIDNIFFGAPVVELETANGRVYTTTATLNSIDVSGARVDNVETVILESMSGVDGLLGQSFLRHFDVNIDRTRGVVAFNRRLDD
ncbi:MAG: TIGR02281 family clan AA aspartic protease [Gammaproteobacteria bacterium]|nr:TIGR02281 family clan AA aspartic protease [Gammaproteobacteria bacterium]